MTTRRRVSPAAGWGLRNEIVAGRPHDCAFDPITHTYTIDGAPVVSVSQVLNKIGLIDFSSVPTGILLRAQIRGTWVHEALRYWQEGDYEPGDAPDEFSGYLDSGINYLNELDKRPLRDAHGRPAGIEARFWDPERRFAGTMDSLGFDRDGVLAIDDWKTGEPSDVAAPLQLAAYQYGARKFLIPQYCPEYQGAVRRRAVKLFADGAPARVEPYTDPRDLQVFFAALAVVNYRENGMRHP